MSRDCVALGTIQAFLDGELSPMETRAVSAHTALCPNCALRLSDADEENSYVFTVLDREIDVLVPTQRLWTRISDSIESEKASGSVWHRFYSYWALQFATPTFAAAAALLVVSGVTFVWISSQQTSNDYGSVAIVPETSQGVQTAAVTTSDPQVPTAASDSVQSPASGQNPQPAYVQVSNHSSEDLKRLVRNAKSQRNAAPRAEYLDLEYVPGEESYIKTIGELERNSTTQTVSLRASDQVAYQRDLAIVEDSIRKMKQVVRKNPRNQSARQVLYASYQDKIDLLNAAAQREELMASLQ